MPRLNACVLDNLWSGIQFSDIVCHPLWCFAENFVRLCFAEKFVFEMFLPRSFHWQQPFCPRCVIAWKLPGWTWAEKRGKEAATMIEYDCKTPKARALPVQKDGIVKTTAGLNTYDARPTRSRAGKRQVAMNSSGSAAPPLKRNHIHQLITIMPQHWRYSQWC